MQAYFILQHEHIAVLHVVLQSQVGISMKTFDTEGKVIIDRLVFASILLLQRSNVNWPCQTGQYPIPQYQFLYHNRLIVYPHQAIPLIGNCILHNGVQMHLLGSEKLVTVSFCLSEVRVSPKIHTSDLIQLQLPVYLNLQTNSSVPDMSQSVPKASSNVGCWTNIFQHVFLEYPAKEGLG